MADLAICNASPFVFLARADLLDLLKLDGRDVVVPDAVAKEVEVRGPQDLACRALKGTAWLHRKAPASIPNEVVAWNIGLGESAVIALALERPGSLVIIDDLRGRRCARALKVPLRGTLGLVLRARQLGRIERARPVVDGMRRAGMYLSDAVVDEALALVGE